jgi:spore coat polysaccharide biosynthesis predicted glycosyltransferase SpsG
MGYCQPKKGAIIRVDEQQWKAGATVDSKVLFRCEANPNIGIGHAIRCLAMAEAARTQQLGIVVAYETMPTTILGAFAEIGAELQPLGPGVDKQTQICLSHFLNGPGGWIVVDVREIDEAQIRALSKGPAHLALMDDGIHEYFDGVDCIINPNIEAAAEAYTQRIKATTALAVGLKYLPLRRQFWNGGRRQSTESQSCAVLITMGGADPDNLSLPLGIACERLTKKAEINLLVGPSFSRPTQLIRRLKTKAPSVRVQMPVQDMANLFSTSDIVVTLAGISLWEAAASGACLVGIARDEVHRATLSAGYERELFAGTFDLRDFSPDAVVKTVEGLIDTPALRLSYAKRSSEIIDGGGALRVINLMQELSLRRAS